ncbi:unnamed protein product [[Candida] boidinii]|nr:unnamed protein product [[Candida] boidinii]
MERASGDDALGGQGHRTGRSGAWNGGDDGGHWSADDDLDNGLWSSASGDDALGGQGHRTGTSGAWNGGGEC